MTAIDAGEPSAEALHTASRLDRSDVIRAAYTLITSLEWGTYQPDVFDVLRVAEFLIEGEN
ncbi:hypothetical protein [Streptomyces tsukubensis]|uniref:hypothetical protein n=1 Tax=Streptomyces tsukubensis TaxID=83656 RepID=UPI00344F1F6A